MPTDADAPQQIPVSLYHNTEAHRLERARAEALALMFRALRNGAQPKPRLARQALRVADQCAAALDAREQQDRTLALYAEPIRRVHTAPGRAA